VSVTSPGARPWSRLFAATALTLFVAAIAVAGYLLASRPLLLLFAVIALVVAVAAGLVALVNRGVRRVAGLGVAVAALAVTVVLLGPAAIAGILTIAGLVAASAGTARAALGRHRPRTHRLPLGVASVGPASRPVLLINPRSGGDATDAAALADEARRRLIKPVILSPHDNLRAIAEREVAGGASVLGMAGGDGSQAVVADVARQHNVAFVCVPAGTFNHFARDLGLDRTDPVSALDAFAAAAEVRIDLGLVNDRVFVNNVSVGAYAMIVEDERYRDMKVATAAALLPDLVGTDTESTFDLRFSGPDGEAFDSADLLLVSNNPYSLVTAAGFAGRQRLDAGELGLVAVRARPPRPGRLGVLTWTAQRLRIDSSESVAAGLDGESVALEPPLEFSVLHRALRVRLSRDTLAPGHAPGLRQTGAALLRVIANRPAWP
jgi:diacylglycerol kinase family enzyme